MKESFFKAIKQGDQAEVRRLLSKSPGLIHEKENGLSPVMVAAYHQEPAIADYLADQIVNLTIFEAATVGDTKQIARHLARDPQLVNAYSDDGFQPLGLACYFGQYEAAEYLINAGANTNSQSMNGIGAAPLQSAAAAGHAKIVMLLLNNGADPNIREKNGYSPLHAAAQNGDTQIIRALLFNGADLNAKGHDDKTPEDLAREAGKTDALALLKEGITRRFRAPKKS